MEIVDFTESNIVFDNNVEYKDLENGILLIINQNNIRSRLIYHKIKL